MNKRLIGALSLLLGLSSSIYAQKVDFTEYDLDNGLHVILHKDNAAPVVTVSVMYHVGSKNEQTNRTGFAHFFEHLLFEGSDNIKRGEFMKIVSKAGGQNNANTTQDRTYYYEVLPSNELETGLWLESERMLHPVINEIGVKTQNEVVKEEKRLRIDNQPYGRFAEEVFVRLFNKHPYHWQTIGSMADLDAAKLEEFKAFFKKFYVPNNACLVIAGDIDVDKTKSLIKAYFGPVQKGPDVVQPSIEEAPITQAIVDSVYDANIQIPAIITAYRVPGMKSRDSYVLNMISTILSNGGSSRLYKKMVDEKKNAIQVGAFPYTLEDYGAYITYALPNNNASLNDLLKDIDEEIAKMQNELISENDYQKLQNIMENNFVNANKGVEGIANNLADAYTFHKNTNLINTELSVYRSITREEIRDVAKKYLSPNQRVLLYYLPKSNQ
ncbi:M16 family metallopeptidase [Solitalea canadensis]|uniref:Putative Zn-dependent peptidase n=1 Tax=Solitalea canadensis (strain ATCC 29591 / DSM 3403 / JCM 21819 / LMG 8368 / NBRC 15130 / NCIMB 12057 / USAM 9D) TaxID=929556 RepID=H8KNZ0_SOLCM|nr:pitrilysin family protein [Solitalea canadensis]AFD05512.1 putative Zn-dependent peptidase [Solitalea canadensis DSM 3403]